jgi:hypothetical protein
VTDYPNLGFDPAPGLDDQVTSLASTVDKVAKQVSDVRGLLGQIGKDNGFWQGEAARNFATTLGELPPYLEKAERSNQSAAQALSGWAERLKSFQAQAREYERQAAEAKAKLGQAQSTLDGYRRSTASTPEQDQKLKSDTATATRAVGDADSALREIIRQAHQLAGQHGDAMSAAARAIRAAAKEAPPEPGFWDKVGKAFSDGMKALEELPGKVWDWVKDHKYLIKGIGDFLSDLSAVVGIVSLFLPPPADVIGLAISGGLGLGALAAHGLAWAAGAKGINAGTLIFDGVAAASGAFGVVGKLGVRGAEEAIAEGTLLGKGGMVAAGEQARYSYSFYDGGSTLVGLAGTGGSFVNGAAADGQLDKSDIPFNKWVPRNGGQAAASVVVGPAGTAFYNYVSDGMDQDDAERKAAWLK